jgi:type I restriction enzyme, S subunit
METAEKLITENLDVWTSAVRSKSSAGRGSSKKRELYGITKLRELILELAVRGMLVPQDPEDEPASESLKSIAKEKAQLIKAGKLKKQMPQLSIEKADEPFTLPTGWEFVRFGDVFSLEYGNNLPAPKRSETGEFPVYGSNGVVGTHKESCIDEPCIVVGRKGSAGALNLCLEKGCWVTDVAYSVVPPSALHLDFVFLHFHTLGLDTLGKGIKPGLSRKEAYKLIACIPPLAEQHRIVAKVDQLMALCDQLKASLATAQATQLNLADSLVEQAIA